MTCRSLDRRQSAERNFDVTYHCNAALERSKAGSIKTFEAA
jgi:hypothetical protein